jgi:hypothetical protein
MCKFDNARSGALLARREAFIRLYRLGCADSRTAPKYETAVNDCGVQNEYKNNDVALSLYEWLPDSDLNNHSGPNFQPRLNQVL